MKPTLCSKANEREREREREALHCFDFFLTERRIQGIELAPTVRFKTALNFEMLGVRKKGNTENN
jgi:hypothetical protein